MRRLVPFTSSDSLVMTKVPNFPVRDFKLGAIARLAMEDWNLPKLRSPALEEVAVSFRANVSSVRLMMSLPTTIAGATAQTHRIYDIAEFEITGKIDESISPEDKKKIDARAQKMLRELAEQHDRGQENADTAWDSAALDYHLGFAEMLKGLVEKPLGASGFIHMFSGYVTFTWTAIETMIGDLWEAAVNTHPKILAGLNGKPRKSANYPAVKTSGDQDRKFDLNLVAKHDYNLRNCMGTIFRSERRFEFTRLSSAREAYMKAFSEKSSKVDAAITSTSFDALSAVRNVLLHKAGVVDDQYVQQQKYLAIPKAAKGERVKLDGQNISDLIKPAISSSKSLMIAVDDWITDN
jgi:hypothetical protein